MYTVHNDYIPRPASRPLQTTHTKADLVIVPVPTSILPHTMKE